MCSCSISFFDNHLDAFNFKAAFFHVFSMIRICAYKLLVVNLKSLHWLPFQVRICFKILFPFKPPSSLAPCHLAELLHPCHPSRSLRSGDQLLLVVPQIRYNSRDERVFSVCIPKLWNSPPPQATRASYL